MQEFVVYVSLVECVHVIHVDGSVTDWSVTSVGTRDGGTMSMFAGRMAAGTTAADAASTSRRVRESSPAEVTG